jgi:hypothetical protein
MNRKGLWIATAGLMLIAAGCGASADAVNQPPASTVCPDTLVQMDRMYFATTAYQVGAPENAAAKFSRSEPAIYCTVLLTADLCCTKVSLVCERAGKIVFQSETEGWVTEGSAVPQPRSLLITPPAGGFEPGDYAVTIFIDIRQVMELGFSVS